jgi:integrase
MRWDQVDLGTGAWTKPAATTKQNRTHRVPLSPVVVAVLKKRHEAARGASRTVKSRTTARPAISGNPWVFPGEGGDGHITTIRSFWTAVCKRAGIKGARIHDLRHTFASLLASSGESLPVIGALLGHTQARTTSRYAHLLDETLRAAMEKAANLASGAKQ